MIFLNDKFNELLNGKNVDSFIQNDLSAEQKKKLNDVLNDKKKLSEILSSPIALELMKKFRNEK